MTRLALRRAVPWVLWLGAATCVAAAPTQNTGVENPVRVERTVFLMGTVATFVAETADREAGLAKLERMVRVEEELKAQRGILLTHVETSDRRFGDMNRRFEDANRRFDDVNRRFDTIQAENQRQHDAMQAENQRQHDAMPEVLRLFEGRVTRLEEKAGIGPGNPE